MVQILHSCDCDCETCDGGRPAPKGIYGGSVCICWCHASKRASKYRRKERKRFKKALPSKQRPLE